jgi:hypothetical protein
VARRSIRVDGEQWDVYPSGRVTLYERDEFALVFQKGTGPDRVRRVARYSPLGARRRDASLAELPDERLVEFFRQSQAGWTSPDIGYARPAPGRSGASG